MNLTHTAIVKRAGFTLIELSIVLVIIGLLIGGVLVGQDLIASARVRAQISQIEKIKSAINTFQVKYNALPGDIAEPNASGFGFLPRGTDPALGDGNGIIMGKCYNSPPCTCGHCLATGETGMVWRDLSTALLIEGSFNTANWNAPATVAPELLFPKAVIGRENFISIWNKNYNTVTTPKLHFQISSINAPIASFHIAAEPALTVREAYNIDEKIDDALPQFGKVRALYFTNLIDVYFPIWAAGGGSIGASGAANVPNTTAVPGTDITCYDNNNVVGVKKYSLGQNGGNGINCAVSIIW